MITFVKMHLHQTHDRKKFVSKFVNINPEYFSYRNFFEKHVSTPTSVQPFLHFDRFLDFVTLIHNYIGNFLIF